MFADFCADQYNSTHDQCMETYQATPQIAHFSMDELDPAFRKIRSARSKDLNGIVAETLKQGGGHLKKFSLIFSTMLSIRMPCTPRARTGRRLAYG